MSNGSGNGHDKPPGEYAVIQTTNMGADPLKKELDALEKAGFEWVAADGVFVYLYKVTKPAAAEEPEESAPAKKKK